MPGFQNYHTLGSCYNPDSNGIHSNPDSLEEVFAVAQSVLGVNMLKC